MLRLTSIIFTLFFTISCYSQDLSKLNQYFDVLSENDKFAGTIIINNNGQQIYSKAFGYADRDNKIKNRAKIKFRIGSITKAFTATMIFQLIDEGKLTLNTKLDTFFSDLPNAKDITIAQLLNHSSGLYNITNEPDFGEWMLEKSTSKELLRRIAKHSLDFSPGTNTAYSNTNYLLLGYIIEKIDNAAYKEILKERIINKIGLNNTYYGGKINVKADESLSYRVANGNYTLLPETDMSNPGGAGAIVSSAGDIATFMDALFAGKLMSASSFEIMKKTNNGETCHGIFYYNQNGIDVYASEGGIDGFQSILVHVPAMNITIAMLSNALDYNKIQIIQTIFASLSGQPITIPSFNKMALTNAQVKIYEGEYACEEVPYKLIFKAKGNKLFGAPEQSNLKELTPTKEHQFTFDNLSIVLDFYPGVKALKFTKGNDKPLMFKKVN